MVKSVVKPLKMGFLRERIVPKKSVFTRVFGVFCFGIPWGRCLAPKPGALPSALHPDYLIFKILTGFGLACGLGHLADLTVPRTVIQCRSVARNARYLRHPGSKPPSLRGLAHTICATSRCGCVLGYYIKFFEKSQ